MEMCSIVRIVVNNILQLHTNDLRVLTDMTIVRIATMIASLSAMNVVKSLIVQTPLSTTESIIANLALNYSKQRTKSRERSDSNDERKI